MEHVVSTFTKRGSLPRSERKRPQPPNRKFLASSMAFSYSFSEMCAFTTFSKVGLTKERRDMSTFIASHQRSMASWYSPFSNASSPFLSFFVSFFRILCPCLQPASG